jgi:hypothetical protein
MVTTFLSPEPLSLGGVDKSGLLSTSRRLNLTISEKSLSPAACPELVEGERSGERMDHWFSL